jgi:hypothetical protein
MEIVLFVCYCLWETRILCAHCHEMEIHILEWRIMNQPSQQTTPAWYHAFLHCKGISDITHDACLFNQAGHQRLKKSYAVVTYPNCMTC